MNSKIILVGNNLETASEIKSVLAADPLYKILQASDFNEAVRKMGQNKTQLVIFDSEVLTEEKVSFVRSLRGLGYPTPVILLGRAIDPKARQLVASSYSKAVIVEKPFAHRHFLGVVSKLVTGRDVSQQTHKRFYTNQEAVIEQLGKNKKYSGAMLNLSKGGAYLEIADDASELSGIVKMKIHLSEVDKQYEVNARVVWNSKSSIWGKGQGIGLEFIQAKDVYRNLLNNI